jgi:hypothetical protein
MQPLSDLQGKVQLQISQRQNWEDKVGKWIDMLIFMRAEDREHRSVEDESANTFCRLAKIQWSPD